MKREVRETSAFIRAAKRLAKKQVLTAELLQNTLELLEEDAFNPTLKTHKLKGDLDGFWSCSLGYDLRLVFRFVMESDSELILLHTIGTHDEIY